VDDAVLSFAAFSLEHAACGDDVLEVRLGEEALLEWCMARAVMMIFRPRRTVILPRSAGRAR
jgi:hypothetical protein